MNIKKLRQHLQDFNFGEVFRDLGWNNPSNPRISSLKNGTITSHYQEIATLGGVKVFQIENQAALTNKNLRKSFHKEITKLAFEHLIIFTDKLDAPTQSLWYWVKRDGKKEIDRDHLFVKGQTGDLFISKIIGMFVDISDLDERGNLPVTEAVKRLGNALDVEKVTKKFYKEFDAVRLEFRDFITGIENEKDKAHYASVLLHRLMFIYFLQAKGFLDTKSGDNGNRNYLDQKLEAYKTTNFYQDFLKDLFFEGFAKPPEARDAATQQKLGHIKYLNGGLFLAHRIELENQNIEVQNQAFTNLFKLFSDYSWNLDDTPEGKDNEINPDVLGYIFEKYINNKAFGAYYTRPEITEYLCKQTIHQLILEKVNVGRGVAGLPQKKFSDLPEMLLKLDANLCTELLEQVLPKLKLLDPACGSGAFLIAALKTLTDIYGAILGRIDILNDPYLNNWKKIQQGNRSTFTYVVKRRIVTDNLFGVDLMPEATDIARLRLFLAMVSSAKSVEDLEPLPNIDFNILSGNSLIGLMHIDETNFNTRVNDAQLAMFDAPEAGLRTKTYQEIIDTRLRQLKDYRGAAELGIENLQGLQKNLREGQAEALKVLNPMLLEEFGNQGIRFEEASWDTTKNKEGKTTKRALTLADIENLEPFHWGFEFAEAMKEGGFDAIIANPPWDTFKPIDREFVGRYTGTVDRRTTSVKEFQAELAKLLKDKTIRLEYEKYLSQYPHVSAFYRSGSQYQHQGRGDVNLYKLFTEQCWRLLRSDGFCGIVIPSGIYSDLGTMPLREMLFAETKVTGLFCFENRKTVFENVDSRFKFVVLTFEKSGFTKEFSAAFMRHNTSDLELFPNEVGLKINVDLIRRLSPDSLSVMEFKSVTDIEIAEKMALFPLLGEQLEKTWNFSLTREFDMTNDSHLFQSAKTKNDLPLYEGKMIWHFDAHYAEPRYWLNQKTARAAILGRTEDTEQQLDYQRYRFGCRSITGNTNERTMVCMVVPKDVFCGNSLQVLKFENSEISDTEILFLDAVMSSYIVDFSLRQRVATQMNFFFVYQTPVPRLTTRDTRFKPIVTRAAKLICTTPEFDELAKSAGLGSHKDGATIPTERAKLRAELDGLIAHLYGLTESEFAHILETFPLVTEGVRLAALNAYQDVRNGLIK